MSHLTISEDALWRSVIAGLADEGFAFDPLTTTRSQLLANALGEPTAYLVKSVPQMLAELNALFGGEALSHLTTSRAALLSALNDTLASEFDADADALFARFTTPPTEDRKALINTCILALKAAGSWSKFEGFYLIGASEQVWTRNWVRDLYNLTAVNGPTFVADSHVVGNGSTSLYGTGFNPTTAVSPKFVQDSGHMGLWSRTDLDNGAAASTDMGDSARARIARTLSVSGQAQGRPNRNATHTIGNGAYPGHAAYSRTGANLWEGYAQGVDTGGGADASAAFLSAEFFLLAAGGTFGTNQLAAGHFGSGLSAAEMLATYDAIHAYLQAVGAA